MIKFVILLLAASAVYGDFLGYGYDDKYYGGDYGGDYYEKNYVIQCSIVPLIEYCGSHYTCDYEYGWYYDVYDKECKKIYVDEGYIYTDNFYESKKDCERVCHCGVETIDPKRNLDPTVECKAPGYVYDEGVCLDYFEPLWMYNHKKGECIKFYLEEDQSPTYNAFYSKDECVEFCKYLSYDYYPKNFAHKDYKEKHDYKDYKEKHDYKDYDHKKKDDYKDYDHKKKDDYKDYDHKKKDDYKDYDHKKKDDYKDYHHDKKGDYKDYDYDYKNCENEDIYAYNNYDDYNNYKEKGHVY